MDTFGQLLCLHLVELSTFKISIRICGFVMNRILGKWFFLTFKCFRFLAKIELINIYDPFDTFSVAFSVAKCDVESRKMHFLVHVVRLIPPKGKADIKKLSLVLSLSKNGNANKLVVCCT